MKMIQSNSSHRNSKGSALAISLIMAAAIVVMAGSYLKLVAMELEQSNRSLLYNLMVNLAEGGADEALWALSHDDWSEWKSMGGDDYIRRQENIGLGNGNRGQLIIMVEDIETDPAMFIESVIYPSRSKKELRKQFVVKLKRRSLFANGITAKDSITFSGGNAKVDSYDSGKGPYDYYINRNDKGSAASMSVKTDAVDVANADIYGYVATGGSWPEAGPRGSIRGADSGDQQFDPDRISTDFYSDFPEVEVPSMDSPQTSLPSSNFFEPENPLEPSSTYYAEVDSGTSTTSTVSSDTVSSTVTIGQSGVAAEREYYSLSDLYVNSTGTLVVDGPVTMVVSGDVDIKGSFKVSSTGSLELYVGGNVAVGGNGIVNETNIPANMQIYQSNTVLNATEVKLHGNGAVTAAVYAPNSRVSLKGGGYSGTLHGAVVGSDVSINGNYYFHYDEALGELGGRGFKLANWKEIHQADEMYPLLNFWESTGS